jgi:hypothetical protein
MRYAKTLARPGFSRLRAAGLFASADSLGKKGCALVLEILDQRLDRCIPVAVVAKDAEDMLDHLERIGQLRFALPLHNGRLPATSTKANTETSLPTGATFVCVC